ncbi:hypothetical protein [Neolewinella persica]|uniref:hypothetical protein n=1 Tax=Neolewinella persica TaxID=70998 RepID=UPI00039F1AFC|nr:hypothetical protein [Neolewinella persica]
MTERLLIFLLFLTACAGGPDVLLENEVASVVEQSLPKGFDPGAYQQYNQTIGNGKTRIVLNGGVPAIIGSLAGAQVQWLEGEEARFRQRSIVVALKPDVKTNDPRLLATILNALDARLKPTGNVNNYVYLRSRQITEDIILATSLHPGNLTEGNAINQFDTAGVHFMNTTGIPLRIEQSTIDFYLPSMQEFFGDSIDRVEFWLETEAHEGVRLVGR